MFDLDDWPTEMAFLWAVAEEFDEGKDRELESQSIQIRLSLEVEDEDN